jgi:hypothetical protein
LCGWSRTSKIAHSAMARMKPPSVPNRPVPVLGDLALATLLVS